MGAPALPQQARDHRAGDVHAARPLAPLRQAALPAGAALPVPASLLLECKQQMSEAEQAQARKLCEPLLALMAIGSLEGSDGLWLF